MDKAIIITLILLSLPSEIYSQNWSNLSNAPSGHNPAHCSRCINNFNTIGIGIQDSGEFLIENYRISNFDNFIDEIVYKDTDGKRKSVEVSDLSTMKIPNRLKLKTGQEMKLVNIGVIDNKSIQTEVQHDVTSNQSISKKIALGIGSMEDESANAVSRIMSEFTLSNGRTFPAFILEIDQAKKEVALKGGQSGIVKYFSVNQLIEPSKKITKLHTARYKNIREAGHRILTDKMSVYKKLHNINPVDAEDEAKKEEESRKKGEQIELLNIALKKAHESNLAIYESYASLLRRFGKNPYEILGSPPVFDPIIHEQYYAHPTWLEIAEVFEITQKKLQKNLDNWDVFTKTLNAKPLKTSETQLGQERKIKVLGTDPVEGFYKFKTLGGEGKLYLYPRGMGSCKITSSIASGEYTKRNYHECEFEWEIEMNPDQSSGRLVFTGVKLSPRSKQLTSISGAELDDYEFQVKQMKLSATLNTGDKVQIERIRYWAKSLKLKD
jgi:hypothetical protein